LMGMIRMAARLSLHAARNLRNAISTFFH